LEEEPTSKKLIDLEEKGAESTEKPTESIGLKGDADNIGTSRV
jgi:hypothetical protein